MRSLTTAADLEYGLLDENDVGEMASLLADVFSRYEPPAVAVGLSLEETEKLVHCLGPKAVAEDLTVIVRARPSGRLVGAMLAEDFATPQPPGIEVAAPHFTPIGALLEKLDAKYRESRTIAKAEYLHLFMLGVSSECGGRGVAQALVTLCVANGRRRGYRAAVTEATGRVSQHVFRKLGFRDVMMESYKDFVHDGRRVFASIRDHEGTILMEARFPEAGAA